MDENKIGKRRQEISSWKSPNKENPTSGGGLVGLKRFIGPAVRGGARGAVRCGDNGGAGRRFQVA
jgi:hypothetical protein